MKRYMDLAREIMLQTEEKASYGRTFIELSCKNVSQQVLSEHVKLLAEAGLIESRVNTRDATLLPARLTWEGHEFLDAARNQNKWNEAKKTLNEKGVLTQLARQAVGL